MCIRDRPCPRRRAKSSSAHPTSSAVTADAAPCVAYSACPSRAIPTLSLIHIYHQDTYLETPSDVDGTDYSAGGALGSGRIDHLCLNCEAIEEFIERLTRNGVEFNERKAHNSNLYQLFMREPINGIKVELNFAWHEAVRIGRVPAWTDMGSNDKPAAEVMTDEAPISISSF